MKVQFKMLGFFFMSLVFIGNSFGQKLVSRAPTAPKPSSPPKPSPPPEKTLYCPYRPQTQNQRTRDGVPTLLNCVETENLLVPGTFYIKITTGNSPSILIGFKEISGKNENDTRIIQLNQLNQIDFPDTKDQTGNLGTPPTTPGIPSAVNMALNQVFSAVADMAVTRAKNLALELAKEQVIKACENTKLNTTIPSLCKKFKEVQFLDLIRDRKILADAVVSDALTYLGRFQSDPGRFDSAIKILINHVLQTSTTATLDSKEIPPLIVRQLQVLDGLWGRIPELNCNEKPDYSCKRLKSVLILANELLEVARNSGFDKMILERILEWSVFRDFSEPSKFSKNYIAEYDGILLHANKIINETCDTVPGDKQSCRSSYISLLNKSNSYELFISNHPEYTIQKNIWDRVSSSVAFVKSKNLTEFRSWFIRFRGILEERDPKIQLKSSFALFMDVLIEIKRNSTLEGKLDAVKKEVAELKKTLHATQLTTQLTEVKKEVADLAKTLDATQLTAQLDVVKIEVADPAKTLDDTQLTTQLETVETKVAELAQYVESLKVKAHNPRQRKKLKDCIEKLAKNIASPNCPKLEAAKLEDKELTEIVNVAELEATKLLVLAIVEKDYASILRSFIDLMQTTGVGSSEVAKKGIATLRLIIGLIEKDIEGEKPEEAKKRRVKLLEEFAERMTSRKDRSNQWIVSLGVSAMLGIAGFDPAERDFKEENKGWNPIGLSIPLGISLEYFNKNGWGFHGMLYPLDLAQYSRVQFTDKSTSVPEPTFYTSLTYGFQFAGSKLYRDVPLTIGLDMRYIPALEYTSISSEAGASIVQQGHFQILFFIGFHFPLLDFN